jgi:hypothetical protein
MTTTQWRRILLASVLTAAGWALTLPASASDWMGLNAKMTVAEQMATLTDQGFTCTQNNALFGVVTRTCRQGDQMVQPGEKRIRFSCEVVDGCAMPFDALAQTLAEQGLVDNVVIERNQTLAGNLAATNKACGQTPAGEQLCVIENISYTTGQAQPEIELRLPQ